MQFNHQFSPTNALRPQHMMQMTNQQMSHMMQIQMQKQPIRETSNPQNTRAQHGIYQVSTDPTHVEYGHAVSFDKTPTPKSVHQSNQYIVANQNRNYSNNSNIVKQQNQQTSHANALRFRRQFITQKNQAAAPNGIGMKAPSNIGRDRSNQRNENQQRVVSNGPK